MPALTRRRRPVQWRRAWTALRRLIAHPEETEQVFELIVAIEGRSGDRLYHRFLKHPDGRRLLAERPSLLATLSDLDALAAMPADSFGRAYAEFMASERLTADGLVAASRAPAESRDDDADPERRWFGDRMRDMHDLWHVLTGYGRDEAGEVANLAFTLGQTRNRGVLMMVLAAALIGPKGEWLGWQRYLYRAWRRGRRAAWLPVVRFEDLLPRPLEIVRGALAIQPALAAHPQGIVVANRSDADYRSRRVSRGGGAALTHAG
jgi:ubiquinone biosynthesis protein COQ4